MFEPIHGSAFDVMGKSIVNPIGTFWSSAMMLEHLGETVAARRPMNAIAANGGLNILAVAITGIIAAVAGDNVAFSSSEAPLLTAISRWRFFVVADRFTNR